MLPTKQGSIRLFRLLGVDVFLHWSWFAVAIYTLSSRAEQYASPFWNIAEYLSLFAIVLMHEFGHSLACRQTGGVSDQIVLWPLGGVAYVQAPQRPGAQLWSIAAGPLVNVVLLPLLYGTMWLLERQGFGETQPDLMEWLFTVNLMNFVLLVFNLLPIYPTDGGQILRALLWFGMGPINSLLIATSVGFVGGAALIGVGLWLGRTWTMIVAAFLLLNCWRAFRLARAWRAQLKAERQIIVEHHEGG